MVGNIVTTNLNLSLEIRLTLHGTYIKTNCHYNLGQQFLAFKCPVARVCNIIFGAKNILRPKFCLQYTKDFLIVLIPTIGLTLTWILTILTILMKLFFTEYVDALPIN